MLTIDDAYKHLYMLDSTFDYFSIPIRLTYSQPYGVITDGGKNIILFPCNREEIENFTAIFEKTKWKLVYPKNLQKCLEEVKEKSIILDIETNQLEIFNNTPKIISFGWCIEGTETAYAIPMEEPFVDAETKQQHIKFVIELLNNCSSFISHNGTMFDLPFIAKVYNLDVYELFKKQKMDTLILAYMLTGGGLTEYKLGYLVRKFVNNQIEWKEAVQEFLTTTEKRKKNRTYDKIPIDILLPYNRLDVYYTNKLYEVLMSKYHPEMKKAITFVLKEIGYLCLKMLQDGLFLDYNIIEYLKTHTKEKKEASIDAAKYFLSRIYEKNNIQEDTSQINFRSAKQTGQAYFKNMGLPVLKTGDKSSAPSVDVKSLQLLLQFEPSILLSHLIAAKWGVLAGYLKNYEAASGTSKLSPASLCCHSYFSPTGTITGRLSSSKPNAQNITTEGMLKAAFCSPDRSVLIHDMRQKMEEILKQKKINEVEIKNERDL